jgi:hypothetical protein
VDVGAAHRTDKPLAIHRLLGRDFVDLVRLGPVPEAELLGIPREVAEDVGLDLLFVVNCRG